MARPDQLISRAFGACGRTFPPLPEGAALALCWSLPPCSGLVKEENPHPGVMLEKTGFPCCSSCGSDLGSGEKNHCPFPVQTRENCHTSGRPPLPWTLPPGPRRCPGRCGKRSMDSREEPGSAPLTRGPSPPGLPMGAWPRRGKPGGRRKQVNRDVGLHPPPPSPRRARVTVWVAVRSCYCLPRGHGAWHPIPATLAIGAPTLWPVSCG